MLKLGIIGTNGISDGFVDAVSTTGAYELHSVLSRTMENAQRFSQKYGSNVQAYSDLNEFLADEILDVVYVATPNSVHFAQTKAALQAKKHVIVEKPAFSNPSELSEVIKVAHENDCYFFEAIRTLYNDGFRAIHDLISKKTVLAASFRFAAYDYRMADVLSGGEPPSFSRKFSGGSLTDIGVYLLYPTIALFGPPKSSFYSAKFLPTGVDGNGIGILDYDCFRVLFDIGRNIQTYSPQSEIYCSDGTLVIDSFSNLDHIIWHAHQGETVELTFDRKPNSMTDQSIIFAEIIKNHDEEAFDEMLKLTQQVNQTMYEMRKIAKISFVADEAKI